MKKTYIQPEAKEIEIKLPAVLAAVSGEDIDDTPVGDDEALSLDLEFEEDGE